MDNNSVKVTKETKNKIRVEFERTSLKERLKAKFVTFTFLQKVIWYVFRLILLIGISYIVLFPFISKIASSFMSPNDFVDVTVRLIPKEPTLDTYKAIFVDNHYMEIFLNTFLLSASTALIQMFICCLIGYGLAKFKFRGNKLIFALVVFTMIVPHQTLEYSMYLQFRYFDIFGIFQLLGGGGIELFGKTFLTGIDIFPDTGAWKMFTDQGINLNNSFWPLILLSLSGIAFKNGLYIFLLRQFFRGVPDELEESAYIDGSNTFHTFLTIILPLSIPMLITVFLFAFSWQWTDEFYTTVFFTNKKVLLMPDLYLDIPQSLDTNYAGQNMYEAAIRNTAGIMMILPLVIVYLFCQKFLVQGIERSGITG
ncbi:MAG: carbohydrate ABC transporter permease [Clostridia bacterium]|nr:carbohydrate ABC transporter permease [Clostridia bacterium]